MDGIMPVDIYSKAQNHWIYFCLIFTRSFPSISSIIKKKKKSYLSNSKNPKQKQPLMCAVVLAKCVSAC